MLFNAVNRLVGRVLLTQPCILVSWLSVALFLLSLSSLFSFPFPTTPPPLLRSIFPILIVLFPSLLLYFFLLIHHVFILFSSCFFSPSLTLSLLHPLSSFPLSSLSLLPLSSMQTGCVPPVCKPSKQRKTDTSLPPPLPPAPSLCSSLPRKCKPHLPTQEDATVQRVLPRGGKNIIVGF